jgi:sec-independent protein translocase protein TatA
MTEHTLYTMAWMPQGYEWLIILVVALLIFGRRLPEIARSVGKSLTEFKKGISEAKDTHDELVNDVKKVGDDVVKETKDAAGLNNSDKAV